MSMRGWGLERLTWMSLAILLGLAGCARSAVLEIHPAVVYEKPRIESISHSLADRRTEGGEILVTVVMLADPALQATFDVYPGVADHIAMREVEQGRYVGEIPLPQDRTGGTYTITGRVRHEKAGEAVIRDPEPLIVYIEPE
jgi:hypothetical protein